MSAWPDWSGETVVLVASGPSAADVPLELGRDRARFLAVKDGWRLCPWADALYGCDHHWWEAHKGVLEFRGQRICYDRRTVEKYRGLGFLRVDIRRADERLLFDVIGKVGWGGHSGFHALNLAMQLGARRLLLVGYDLRVDRGKHFFGEHKYSRERPSAKNVERWRQILDGQAPIIAARGVEVVNCGMVSTLTAFRKMAFEDALEGAVLAA